MATAHSVLQVGFDEEEAGLDAYHHGETAYAGEGRTADVAGRRAGFVQRVPRACSPAYSNVRITAADAAQVSSTKTA